MKIRKTKTRIILWCFGHLAFAVYRRMSPKETVWIDVDSSFLLQQPHHHHSERCAATPDRLSGVTEKHLRNNTVETSWLTQICKTFSKERYLKRFSCADQCFAVIVIGKGWSPISCKVSLQVNFKERGIGLGRSIDLNKNSQDNFDWSIQESNQCWDLVFCGSENLVLIVAKCHIWKQDLICSREKAFVKLM